MKVATRIELEFAGITLPVGKDAEGGDIVPVKPICDMLGLDWKTQYQKMQPPLLAPPAGGLRSQHPPCRSAPRDGLHPHGPRRRVPESG